MTRTSLENWIRQRLGLATVVLIMATLPLPLFAQAGASVADAGQRSGLSDSERPDEDITFARDIVPILQENCQVCHQPGSIGPMTFMSYEEVRPWAPMIKDQVVTRNMPPYHYDPGIGIQELQGDRRLSEEEIETIVSWVDSGTPLGDVADMPPPVSWPDASQWRFSSEFGEPDIVLQSDPFNVPAHGQDIWWRPMAETGITEDRCIMAIEVKPSVRGRPAVHHAIPSFRIQGDDGRMSGGGTLTEYAVGKEGETIPADGCRVAPANSLLSWDIHYYPMGEDVPDDVIEVGLWLYPADQEPKYQQTLRSYSLERQGGGPVLDIAPHSTIMTQGFFSWDHPVRIDSYMPHGHFRLRAKWLEVYHPESGEREFISMVSNFHPGWQNSYTYADHVAPLLPKGSVMILTALHDNTANNPHNPDPDQWVNRGSRTTDEMSHAWIAITHLDEEGFQELVAERELMRNQDLEHADDDR